MKKVKPLSKKNNYYVLNCLLAVGTFGHCKSKKDGKDQESIQSSTTPDCFFELLTKVSTFKNKYYVQSYFLV